MKKLYRRNVGPHGYFTREWHEKRTRDRLPRMLFHFTQPHYALRIFSMGLIKGRPTVSTSENPALHFTPGPIVFVLDPVRILKAGFTLWPYIWGNEYQEAEWVVASKDAEYYPDSEVFDSQRVLLPLRGIVALLGYPESWTAKGTRPRPKLVRDLRDAARHYGIPVKTFSWDRWWKDGLTIPRGRK